MMKPILHARKKRQVKRLAQELQAELVSFSWSERAQNLYRRLRQLLAELAHAFSRREAVRALGALALTLGLGSVQGLFGQQFNSLQIDPFNLSTNDTLKTPAFVDIDGDGDLDLFTGGYYTEIKYYQNNGSATAPNFAAAQSNPLGLDTLLDMAPISQLNFADLDNDGDYDILVMSSANPYVTYNYNFTYHYIQNTGTATAPVFNSRVEDPFNLPKGTFAAFFDLADLDDDGDLDLLHNEYGGGFAYFENTGTAQAPSFAAPVSNPFGLTNGAQLFEGPRLADLDGDGDLDLLSGSYSGNFFYRANTGTKTNPAFGARQTNPFGLDTLGTGTFINLVDLDGDLDLDLFTCELEEEDFFYFPNSGNTSLFENSLEQVSLYPNPSRSQVRLNSKLDGLSWRILDESGRQLSAQLSQGESIDVSEYSPGLYIVEISRAGQAVGVAKLMVQ